MKVYFNEKSKSFLLTLLFICFSLILFFSCGGEKANVPDDESVIDNEIEDSNDVETEDEIVDEVEEEENDSDIDEVVYTELENWEECEDSPCSQLCLLMWDEETKERVYWFNLARNGEEIYSKDRYLDIWLETSHNLCYVNFEDHTENLGDSQTIAEKIPISAERETGGDPYYGSIIYFFIFDTGENFGEKKKYNYEAYTSCINDDGINWCEEKGNEPVYVEGIEGPCYKWADMDFVPLPPFE